jgi:hypothetical protein
VVTVAAQTPLLQAAPPLQSLLVVQEHTPEPQVEVEPLGTEQLASLVHASPVIRHVPVAAWHALPVQSALLAQLRGVTA